MKLLERRAANLRLGELAAYRVSAIGYPVQRWAANRNPNPNLNPSPNPNLNPSPNPTLNPNNPNNPNPN